MKRIIVLGAFVSFGLFFAASPGITASCHGGGDMEGMNHQSNNETTKSVEIEKSTATVYVCPTHPESIKHDAGNCPVCGKILGAKQVLTYSIKKEKHLEQAGENEETQEVVTYTCPMHPEVKSSKPGTCPKCGMALEIKDSQKSLNNAKIEKSDQLNQDDIVICPVMGTNMKKSDAYAWFDYEGKTYYICCAKCKPELLKNPKKYTK